MLVQKPAEGRECECTCGVGLAVVLPTVLHFDGRQAERLDHLVGALTPVGGAEGQDGEGQGEGGQGQGEQGARAARHVLQHGCTGRGEKQGEGKEIKGNRRCYRSYRWIPGGVGQMLFGGFKTW